MQGEREDDLSSFLNGRPITLDYINLPFSQRKTGQLHTADPLPLLKKKTPNPTACIPFEP